MLVLVMGIAGSGKSSVAQALSDALGLTLIEADDFHPSANKAKMAQGIPLTDADRWPWLDALAREMDQIRARGGSAVVTCSALKQAYRDRLLAPDVQLVYLKVSPQVVRERVGRRAGHFFPPALLQSQLDTLEEPTQQTTRTGTLITVDADQDLPTLIPALIARLQAAQPDKSAR